MEVSGEVNFDLARMKRAVEGPFRVMPTGLTREQFREWMLMDAVSTRLSNERSMKIAKRGRDAIVAASSEEYEGI